jgi:hypothetical protein
MGLRADVIATLQGAGYTGQAGGVENEPQSGHVIVWHPNLNVLRQMKTVLDGAGYNAQSRIDFILVRNTIDPPGSPLNKPKGMTDKRWMQVAVKNLVAKRREGRGMAYLLRKAAVLFPTLNKRVVVSRVLIAEALADKIDDIQNWDERYDQVDLTSVLNILDKQYRDLTRESYLTP